MSTDSQTPSPAPASSKRPKGTDGKFLPIHTEDNKPTRRVKGTREGTGTVCRKSAFICDKCERRAESYPNPVGLVLVMAGYTPARCDHQGCTGQIKPPRMGTTTIGAMQALQRSGLLQPGGNLTLTPEGHAARESFLRDGSLPEEARGAYLFS